jgi:molybdopterin-containing oxidoreductase family iron-sulfur binding subunit
MSIDFSTIRSRLAGSEGRLYWRSLGELSETPEFREYLHREFPEQASEWNDPKGRRDFLKLMSASLALAGIGACTKQPPEAIVPYVRQPEEIVPGRPLFFASAVPFSGVAQPVLVESHMGRPTKIEGNPEHPASLGATDVLTQASILELYDPDRAQTLTLRGEVRPWGAFLSALQNALNAQRARKGAGLRFLTPPITSPTLGEMMTNILREFPEARWHSYDAVTRPAASATATAGHALFHFERADVIVSLDGDFLGCGPGSVRYARDFADRRRIGTDRTEMSRLYVVESTPTLTGTKADHRLPLPASDIEGFARQLAAAVGAGGQGSQGRAPSGDEAKWIAAVARDLQVHRGRSLVIAGDYQPAAVHGIARAMNDALGNTGTTVTYSAGIEAAAPAGTLGELAKAMDAGQVEMLLIAGGNPVFTAPADLKFAERLAKVGLAIYHGLYADETAYLCHWHVPEAHALETWGDARAYDGTVTITQPLIAPLYEGRSLYELIAAFTPQADRRTLDLVKDYWSRAHGAGAGGWTLRDAQGEPYKNTETFWRRAVHDGFIVGTAVTAAQNAQAAAAGTPTSPEAGRTPEPPRPPAPEPSSSRAPEPPSDSLEIIFRPDPRIFDGRFANNGWLQELPKPLTKVTWDPTAWIAPRLAEAQRLRNGDLVDLRYRGATVRLPVFIVPGHPAASVTVFFGYGRRNAGRVGNAVAEAERFNAFLLRTSDAPWFGRGLQLSKVGENYPIVTVQEHQAMEGRHPVRTATLEEYKAKPSVIHDMGHTPPRTLSLYPEQEYNGYKWGMAIDLTACYGCGACTVACVAENNIPVVGKYQVGRNREMHWIRVDTYYSGDPFDNPQALHQPVPCMQCENAPCEVVCPVAATTHSSEGLNDMVYNRCVGTRYCSNNCPYKVRRFNFLLYADWYTQSFYPQRNPDVTVRSRGVMEKCTYCVQRINQARVDAKREDRRIRDGEVVTACQAVCPADAIVFGDMNDPNSQVNKLKAQERNYGVLEELNTRPRTTYLAALRNPNPELEPAAAGHSTGH